MSNESKPNRFFIIGVGIALAVVILAVVGITLAYRQSAANEAARQLEIRQRYILDFAEAWFVPGMYEKVIAVLAEEYELTGSAEIAERLAEYEAAVEAMKEAEAARALQKPDIDAGVYGIIQFGGYDWRVLDIQDGKRLVISEMVLESRDYHATPHAGSLATTWEESDIRAYLNGEFLERFSAEDRARIAETRLVNNDNPWYIDAPRDPAYPPHGGNDTTDRVFLLSIDEVLLYFGDSGDLAGRKAWLWDSEKGGLLQVEDGNFIHDQYNGNRVAYHVGGEYYWKPSGEWHTAAPGTSAWWWLRSPGDASDSAAAVHPGGGLRVGGYAVDAPGLSGVRPAMWLENVRATDP